MGSSVNTINIRTDLTPRIFDQFSGAGLEVPADQYDVVNSFFRSVFSTGEAAAAFTQNLFEIARATSTPVLTLLDQMQDQDAVQINATMCYYLNGVRSPTTLLGINAVVRPNIWAARNVMT